MTGPKTGSRSTQVHNLLQSSKRPTGSTLAPNGEFQGLIGIDFPAQYKIQLIAVNGESFYHQKLMSSTILVVEDHEPFQRLICSMLEQTADLRVIGQEFDGLRGVQRAAQLRPNLILLDIGLPTLNGLRAAQQLQRLVPCAKILFVSQESSEDVVQAMMDSGALGYVHKSRIHSDLLPAIQAALAGQRFVSSHLEIRGWIGAPLANPVGV